jgi:hypothetical protein
MPRRFALALVVLLLLLLLALLLGRRMRGPSPAAAAVPTLRPTAVIPPTPIPARQVSLYFESLTDDRLHPEARDVPAAVDDVAFLRSVAAAVMDGPRRQELVRPFPEGWSLRGAYLLREGIAVIDLSPPPLLAPREPGTPMGALAGWLSRRGLGHSGARRHPREEPARGDARRAPRGR